MNTQKTWHCVQKCGACCHLDPSDRPDLEHYLSPEELELYLSMVGEDGWCIHFNQQSRKCHIYRERPRFCRVNPDNFRRMYGILGEEFNDFAIECCQEQISGIFGEESEEMARFQENH